MTERGALRQPHPGLAHGEDERDPGVDERGRNRLLQQEVSGEHRTDHLGEHHALVVLGRPLATLARTFEDLLADLDARPPSSPDVTYCLAGDATYDEQLLLEELVDGVTYDVELSKQTLRQIMALGQQEPTILLPAHDRRVPERLSQGLCLPRQPHRSTTGVRSAAEASLGSETGKVEHP